MKSQKKPVHTSVSFRSRAWRRLKKNKGAMTGLYIVIFSVWAGIFAYVIAPDHTPNANQMVLALSGKAPGYEAVLLGVRKQVPVEDVSFWEKLIHGAPSRYTYIPIQSKEFVGDSLRYMRYVDEDTAIAESIDLLHLVYLLPPGKRLIRKTTAVLFYKNAENQISKVSITSLRHQINTHQIKHRTYWLGTDKYGRDILSRIIVGVRVSLSVGLIAVLISLFIGISLGAAAGYFRGKTDDVIMWLINVVWSVPSLLLVFALTMAIGKGFWQIFIAVGLTLWVGVARIVRGQVMSLREMPYIEATRALGFGSRRIIVRHILPNMMGPVLVIAANNFATAIVIEAGLSFLGIGVQPPTPSWGLMLKENYGFIITHNPMLAIIPGLAIMIMVLAFNLLGNGLRDAMDVREG